MQEKTTPAWLDRLAPFLERHGDDLVRFRRDIHMHPELGFEEFRTTEKIVAALEAAGLRPARFPETTGVTLDITGGPGPTVALRADIDALSLPDEKTTPYRSTLDGLCHACGHDVHTTVVLGAGLFLAELAERNLFSGTVRLIFQPAEENLGGARDVVKAGGLDGVGRIFAVHCEPRYEVGQIGLRTGAITGAYDRIRVQVRGRAGEAASTDLSADLVHTLAKIITELPAALSRRVDPRSSLSLVWGMMDAGSVLSAGLAEGTVRCLDREAREKAPALIENLLQSVVSAYGMEATLEYIPGIPPTVNEDVSVGLFRAAVTTVLGEEAVVAAPQSLGGDDFGIYLESVPGAYARLGVRSPGSPEYDLHQGTFDVDEKCIPVGVRVLSAVALEALGRETREPLPAQRAPLDPQRPSVI